MIFRADRRAIHYSQFAKYKPLYGVRGLPAVASATRQKANYFASLPVISIAAAGFFMYICALAIPGGKP